MMARRAASPRMAPPMMLARLVTGATQSPAAFARSLTRASVSSQTGASLRSHARSITRDFALSVTGAPAPSRLP
jgi:hypothetical protein